MRIALLVLVSALGACNPSAPQEAPAPVPPASAFPNLAQAAYRAEVTVSKDGHTVPLVMIRDGRNMRLEVDIGQGPSAIISNGETGETLVIVTMGGRTMALHGDNSGFTDPAAAWSAEIAATATRTGACAVAGETGAEWTRTENGIAKTACVTQDGIILRTTEAGVANWETTNVQRGPQSAALFTVPPGVQVMNLGNMGAALNDAIGRAGGQ